MKFFTKIVGLLFCIFLLSGSAISSEWKMYLNKGNDLSENCRHKEKEALEQFKKAYSLNPDDFETNYWLGKGYYDNRMYEEAKEYLEEAVRLRPQDVEANAHLAYNYGRLGEDNFLKRAIYMIKSANQLKKVLDLDHNYPGAYFSLAIACTYLEWYEKPTGLFRQIAKIFFKDEKEVDNFNADSLFKRAISLKPNDAWHYTQYGWYFLKRGKPSEAKKNFDKGMELAEKDIKCKLKNSGVPRAIAIYYEEQMMWDEALKYAKISLQWNLQDLCLEPRLSIKKLILRLEEEKKENKLLLKNVADEL